jgi:hypothetical protein
MRAQMYSVDPRNEKEVMHRADQAHWLAAMDKELTSLHKHDTWTLSPVPAGRSAISTKWIFKTKYNADGSICKHKARLVVRGFTQKEGIDFTECYAPVARHTSLRVLLSIAASDDMELHQCDIETAFLNAELTEEVYIRLPTGETARLHKCLYGSPPKC